MFTINWLKCEGSSPQCKPNSASLSGTFLLLSSTKVLHSLHKISVDYLGLWTAGRFRTETEALSVLLMFRRFAVPEPNKIVEL